jgi:hypothetical protein
MTELTGAEPILVDVLPLDVESDREALVEALSDVRIGKRGRQVWQVEKRLMLGAGKKQPKEISRPSSRELKGNLLPRWSMV